MTNTKVTNREVNTKKNNAKKGKKNNITSSKAFIAAVSASVTALTMAAGIALTAAILSPAQKDEVKPAAAAVTVQAPQSVSAEKPVAVNTGAKTVTVDTAKTKTEDKAAPAAEQKAAPAAQQKAAPAVQQSGTPVIPEGEINDWKVHNAKDGFPIGTYFGKADNKSTLNVVKLDNVNYKITVTIPTGENTAEIYSISAYANGSKMYYNFAVKTSVEFDANGNVINSKAVSNTNQGTFDASDAGYTWIDTDGITVFIPWIGYR